MSDFILLLLIVVLLVCLVVTVLGFVLYSGLLSEVVIKTGPPPIRNVTIAYKFKQGSYKDCGAAYTETCSIGPKLSSIGVFYDDPKQVRPSEIYAHSLITQHWICIYTGPHDNHTKLGALCVLIRPVNGEVCVSLTWTEIKRSLKIEIMYLWDCVWLNQDQHCTHALIQYIQTFKHILYILYYN